MKRKLAILFFLSISLTLFSAAQAAKPATAGKSNTNEERLYADGTRAINEARWADAEAAFDQVVEQHGQRAEGALYWKAYAENKAGQSSKALATCVELRRAFPKSRWLDECGALEIEIRSKSGQPVQPHSEHDEELKLLALNALMQQDEARALPIIQQILTGNGPDKIKERALFVLAQSGSKQAQDVLGQIARGQTNPTLQVKAIQMIAAMQGRRGADILADIYQHSSDERVKKSVLHSYIISGSADKLMDAAQHETNPELARTAVHALGAVGATNELLTVYRNTTSAQTKAAVLDGLIASGRKGADSLASIATSEQDASLRRKAIQNLGVAGGPAVAPSLLATYQKNSDPETRKAAVEALFLAGAAHDLVELAKAEKDPAMKQMIVQRLSLMHSKEASDYMLELLK
jgi:HEAT repeat protein